MRRLPGFYGLIVLVLSAAQVVVADEAVPTGKLSADATPLAYTLNFKIDPRQARFSAQVRIRVTLAKTTQHLWLHAQDLDVTRTELADAGGKIHKATFFQRSPD